MVRQLLGAGHDPIVETRGVVVVHGFKVVGVIVVNQHYALNGVLHGEGMAKYVGEVVCYGAVAHQLTHAYGAVAIVMRHCEIA